jgi:endothelin-converting enzyme/putative endopeptidase
MDRTADPCADFYQYSCGGWMKANPIPSDQPAWNVYYKLAQDNVRFLWGILEDAAKPAAGRNPCRPGSATTSLRAWTRPRWKSAACHR